MTSKFGLFINMNYAHKPKDKCLMLWDTITDKMLNNGFSFHKRVFVLTTEITSNELSAIVRNLLFEIQENRPDLYDYISDCYILNIDACENLLLPDTSNSIDVEHINIQDFDFNELEHIDLEK